jgi:hypothetical protein
MDRRACTFRVDRFREAAQAGKRLLAHPDLMPEGAPLGADGAVRQGGHSDATRGELAMPFDQAIRHEPVARHALVRPALHDAVAQRDGSEMAGCEDPARLRSVGFDDRRLPSACGPDADPRSYGPS